MKFRTLFCNGPAKGQMLSLKRAPLLLRVTESATTGTWDALDEPEDAARPDERLHLYRLRAPACTTHVDGRDARGRRTAEWFWLAEYEHVTVAAVTPEDEVLRDNERWNAWAQEHHRSLLCKWALDRLDKQARDRAARENFARAARAPKE